MMDFDTKLMCFYNPLTIQKKITVWLVYTEATTRVTVGTKLPQCHHTIHSNSSSQLFDVQSRYFSKEVV